MQTPLSQPSKKPRLHTQATLNHSELLQLSSELHFSHREKQPTLDSQKEAILLRIASTVSVETVENEVIDLEPQKRIREEGDFTSEIGSFSPLIAGCALSSPEEIAMAAADLPKSVLLLRFSAGEEFVSLQCIFDLRGKAEYHIWMRWGKCGQRGRKALIGPFLTLQRLKNRLYDLKAEKEAEGYVDSARKSGWNGPIHTRSEAHKVETLSRLLTSEKLSKATLKEVGYGYQTKPFSQLTQTDINSGFTALKSTENAIINGDLEAIPSYTKAFYELIPHKQPYDTDGDTQIDHIGKLRTQLSFLSTLSSLKQQPSEEYLQTRLVAVDKDSELFAKLKDSFDGTKGGALMYETELEDAFEVKDEAEMEEDNTVGLWYGAKTCTWGQILRSGVPARSSAQALFPGVQLYDCASRATADCVPVRSNPIGFIALCQVALGDLRTVEVSSPLSHFESLKVVGRMEAVGPSVDVGGVKVVTGPVVSSGLRSARVVFPEYIVRDPARVKPKYLLQLRFLFP